MDRFQRTELMTEVNSRSGPERPFSVVISRGDGLKHVTIGEDQVFLNQKPRTLEPLGGEREIDSSHTGLRSGWDAIARDTGATRSCSRAIHSTTHATTTSSQDTNSDSIGP